MRLNSIVFATALLVISSVQAAQQCSLEDAQLYAEDLDYSATLQDMIDEASRLE
jgi:hypothetical protein